MCIISCRVRNHPHPLLCLFIVTVTGMRMGCKYFHIFEQTSTEVLLCRVWLFCLCLRGFSPSPTASYQRPKTCISGKGEVAKGVNKCEQLFVFVGCPSSEQVTCLESTTTSCPKIAGITSLFRTWGFKERKIKTKRSWLLVECVGSLCALNSFFSVKLMNNISYQ